MKVADRYLDHRGVEVTAAQARQLPAGRGWYVTDDAGHPLAFFEFQEEAEAHVVVEAAGRVEQEAA